MHPIEVKNLPTRLKPSSRRCRLTTEASITVGLEAWFIAALVKAGRCYNHQRLARTSPFFPVRRPESLAQSSKNSSKTFRKFRHTNSAEASLPAYLPPIQNPTREELLELVDQYGSPDPLPPLPNRYQPSDGPYLTVSDKPEDEWPPPNHTWPANPDTKVKLNQLEHALRNETIDPQEIYELYRALPAPRAPYLQSRTRHRMLRHLTLVERKDEHSMLRYLSVVDDMRASAIPLRTEEWTSAISFVSRYVEKSTEVEVEAALQMWKEMEHGAGVRGNSSTFTVLFDIACKAGKFTLAEMIYTEMQGRGLEFDRYTYVSMIFYHGLKRNGDGARASFRELVEAGEMVDTVVLNAMISALIRAREATAAHNIYERMKRSYTEGLGPSNLPPSDFRKRRKLTRVLKRMAKEAKIHKEKRPELQRKTIMAPDIRTFRLLICYYAVVEGDLDKTTELLDEMSLFELPLHGTFFIALLQGFARHGGVRYTKWHEKRLERVWTSLLKALDSGTEGVCISKHLVIWVLRAFAKCSGKSRTLAAWEEIKERWNPCEEDLQTVMSALRILLDATDMAQQRYDWLLGSL